MVQSVDLSLSKNLRRDLKIDPLQRKMSKHFSLDVSTVGVDTHLIIYLRELNTFSNFYMQWVLEKKKTVQILDYNEN